VITGFRRYGTTPSAVGPWSPFLVRRGVKRTRRPVWSSSPVELTDAVAVLNRACASAPAWSELAWSATPTRTVNRAPDGPDGVLAQVAEEAVDLFTGPRRADLRACHGPGCVRYFLRDHPRCEWCSSGCGNRARVARHYQRHRGD
jgi:predicted RNA-binding Zn ribbon-like protein